MNWNRPWRLALLFAAGAAAQVAEYANGGYRSEEGRARVAQSLSAHDREETQKPRELVEMMNIAPDMTVADIGTGVGFMLPYLHDALGSAGRILAEDIFPDFLEKARSRVKERGLNNVTFILGTDKDPKLPAGQVDVALVLDAYHHFDYPAEMLNGLARGLKENGRLVIVDFYKAGFRDPKHIRLDQADVIKEVEANGFKLVSNGPFTPNRQYIAVFRKN